MRWEEISRTLEDRPIFTTVQLASILGKSPEYATEVVHRWISRNKITRIERGKYTTQSDPLLVASSITWPSYLSIWNSLSYHNLTEQIPHSFWVFTTRYRKNSVLSILNTQIFFIKIDPSQLFGYQKIVRDGIEIFMADPEKAIVDSVLFKKISIPEIQEIIQLKANRISKQKLIEYSLRTGNVALIKRIGYMMDMSGYDFFYRLKGHIYDQVTILEPNLPSKGLIDHKWKVKDNVGK